MRLTRPITAFAAATLIALVPASTAVAQRQQPTPEQRIDRLERQIEELQRRVFPKGRPADTAGFREDPAATQSAVIGLDQRLDALERQLTDLLRLTEENGNRVRNVESALGQFRSATDERMTAIEQRIEAAATAAPVPAEPAPPAASSPSRPKPSVNPPKPPPNPPKSTAQATPPAATGGPALAETDPGEDAYTEGFRLWEAGKYDEAIKSLRAFVSAYPKHRRASYANNLIGRALLDSGQPRAAAEALLANYRNNPAGERAADSLFYLGQALMQLGQPAQACKAYSELDAVYGAKIRPDLKKLETEAKAQANCA